MRWLALLLIGCGSHQAALDAQNIDAPPAPPAIGILDGSFGTAGIVQISDAVDLAATGVAPVGSGYVLVGSQQSNVAKLVAIADDGTTSDFASSNLGSATAIAGTSRGLLVLSNATGATADLAFAMFDPNGAPIESYGASGIAQLDILGADQPSRFRALPGHALACVSVDSNGADPKLALVAVGDSGKLDTSFGTGGVAFDNPTPNTVDYCNDLVVDSQGVLAVGQGSSQLLAAHYLPSGVRDTAFATGGVFRGPYGALSAVAATADGYIAVGHMGTAAALASFTTTGIGALPATTVQYGIDDSFQGVAVDSVGHIVVAGHLTMGSNTDAVIARFNADGSPDLGFGTMGKLVIDVAANDRFEALALDGKGRIVAVGSTRPTAGPSQILIARVM